MSSLLTVENYRAGMLIDDELMAGVTENPEKPGEYMAYVVRHTTGEYLGAQAFLELEQALQVLNQIPRAWVYAKTAGGCGGGNCSGGGCGGGGCGGSGGGCGCRGGGART